MEERKNLFVYGLLRKGLGLHDIILRHRGKFKGYGVLNTSGIITHNGIIYCCCSDNLALATKDNGSCLKNIRPNIKYKGDIYVPNSITLLGEIYSFKFSDYTKLTNILDMIESDYTRVEYSIRLLENKPNMINLKELIEIHKKIDIKGVSFQRFLNQNVSGEDRRNLDKEINKMGKGVKHTLLSCDTYAFDNFKLFRDCFEEDIKVPKLDKFIWYDGDCNIRSVIDYFDTFEGKHGKG